MLSYSINKIYLNKQHKLRLRPKTLHLLNFFLLVTAKYDNILQNNKISPQTVLLLKQQKKIKMIFFLRSASSPKKILRMGAANNWLLSIFLGWEDIKAVSNCQSWKHTCCPVIIPVFDNFRKVQEWYNYLIKCSLMTPLYAFSKSNTGAISALHPHK